MNYMRIKKENDDIFRKNRFSMKSETVKSFSGTPVKREKYYYVSENTEKATTIQAVLSRADGRKIVALNFANATQAGGAYILGGNAQEESLCRASMLYYTIREQKEYYNTNRLHMTPDYTDVMIYSENVPVIRDDSGKMLDKPAMCDFITSPAVNRTFAKFIMPQKKINSIMKTRIEKIIMLAVSKKADVIILGAFGCGVFGNRREDVFPLFEDSINRYVPDSTEVVFAVP